MELKYWNFPYLYNAYSIVNPKEYISPFESGEKLSYESFNYFTISGAKYSVSKVNISSPVSGSLRNLNKFILT